MGLLPLVLQDFEMRFTDFTSKLCPEALLGDVLLGEVLAAADEFSPDAPLI